MGENNLPYETIYKRSYVKLLILIVFCLWIVISTFTSFPDASWPLKILAASLFVFVSFMLIWMFIKKEFYYKITHEGIEHIGVKNQALSWGGGGVDNIMEMTHPSFDFLIRFRIVGR